MLWCCERSNLQVLLGQTEARGPSASDSEPLATSLKGALEARRAPLGEKRASSIGDVARGPQQYSRSSHINLSLSSANTPRFQLKNAQRFVTAWFTVQTAISTLETEHIHCNYSCINRWRVPKMRRLARGRNAKQSRTLEKSERKKKKNVRCTKS